MVMHLVCSLHLLSFLFSLGPFKLRPVLRLDLVDSVHCAYALRWLVRWLLHLTDFSRKFSKELRRIPITCSSSSAACKTLDVQTHFCRLILPAPQVCGKAFVSGSWKQRVTPVATSSIEHSAWQFQLSFSTNIYKLIYVELQSCKYKVQHAPSRRLNWRRPPWSLGSLVCISIHHGTAWISEAFASRTWKVTHVGTSFSCWYLFSFSGLLTYLFSSMQLLVNLMDRQGH